MSLREIMIVLSCCKSEQEKVDKLQEMIDELDIELKKQTEMLIKIVESL